MKLSDFLTDVGRPIAFYPGLRKITGSTTSTVLLCQLIYWTGKESGGDGWVYKTSEEIEEETGLSYYEQKGAREKLTEAGLLQEKYARIQHTIYFKVDLDKLNDKWGNEEKPDCPMRKNPDTQPGKTSVANEEIPNSLIGTTETTTQNTTENGIQKTIPELSFWTTIMEAIEYDPTIPLPNRRKIAMGVPVSFADKTLTVQHPDPEWCNVRAARRLTNLMQGLCPGGKVVFEAVR